MSIKIEPKLEDFFKAAHSATAIDPIGVSDGGEVSLVDVDREGLYCTYGLCTSITDEERAFNQRVWGVFEKAVNEAYVHKPALQARVDRLCRRYGIDFNLAKEGNIPLLADHVQKVGVGATRLFVQDLIAFAGENIDLYNLSREEIQKIMGSLRGPHLIANPSSIDHVRGGPDECEDMVVFDPYRLDKKLAQLLEKVDDLLEQDSSHIIDFPYIDRIAKVATSLELEVGQIIPAPVLVDGRTQIDYYEVYRKIGTGDGLVAYALKPIAKDSKLPPSLYFRCTQITLVAEDAPESWFNDCEENIGLTGYRAAHGIFADLMKDERFVKKGEKIRLCGYSLGSTQASRFLVDFWQQVNEAILINGPSLDLETATRFRDAINALPKVTEKGREPSLKMQIYRNKGDISSYAGNKHVGWGVELDRGVTVRLTEFGNIPHVEYGRVLGNHSTRPEEPMLRDKYNIEQIDYFELEQLTVQLDNFARGDDVAWYERTRLFWGTRVLYMLVYGIYLLAKGILSCFGVELFRSSRSEILPAAPIAELADNKA
jgi:hypothetical protein